MSLLRRYHFLLFLFSLCLSTMLLFSTSKATSTQVIAAESQPSVTQEEIPSLTTDVRKTVLENGLTVLTKEVHTSPPSCECTGVVSGRRAQRSTRA